MTAIDYYFICSSPFAYLGHKAFHELAATHGATIRYKPISIAGVWEKSGSVPLGQRTPVRQRYRRIELQRIADIRGLPINLEPKFFPVDPTLADRCVIVLAGGGKNPAGFIWRVKQGVWANEENIADRDQLAAYLGAEGHDAEAVLSAAQAEPAGETLSRNTREATEVDAIGAPVYVLNGEPFWGQDRLDYLAHALETKRGPFKP
ncbi:2-hydroxychromene-2-carboxylate isomerase [Mesorhizobium microcysteis]|uniref:2-hydroxychromene-2-carboxylate isomerase n=1 Tax=Neoaquamicrobium microcysteis TaxID=2682781 RepID=A0A5D4GN60_9HYPH|nr:2-hydroxychromene-2-carboxylate isomerase [Mesorhizobium microcysteis]TYR29403.1 2-hydroxychromene-2-carboxylate isomerase [Mesorhizobium microcysteis]